jgi:hypothetical protein
VWAQCQQGPRRGGEETVRHYLQVHDFSVEQGIENRLLA